MMLHLQKAELGMRLYFLVALMERMRGTYGPAVGGPRKKSARKGGAYRLGQTQAAVSDSMAYVGSSRVWSVKMARAVVRRSVACGGRGAADLELAGDGGHRRASESRFRLAWVTPPPTHMASYAPRA